jgi:hypothetical protein
MLGNAFHGSSLPFPLSLNEWSSLDLLLCSVISTVMVPFCIGVVGFGVKISRELPGSSTAIIDSQFYEGNISNMLVLLAVYIRYKVVAGSISMLRVLCETGPHLRNGLR